MRGFGFAAEDTVVDFGINAKLNEIHAAMALASLDELEDLVWRNRVRYDAYRRGLDTVRGISVREFDEHDRDAATVAHRRTGALGDRWWSPFWSPFF